MLLFLSWNARFPGRYAYACQRNQRTNKAVISTHLTLPNALPSPLLRFPALLNTSTTLQSTNESRYSQTHFPQSLTMCLC